MGCYQSHQQEPVISISHGTNKVAPLLPTFHPLFKLRVSMGGPGFGNYEATSDQSIDNVEKFVGMLDKYISEGGTVNDTASFKEIFDYNLEINGWTLLFAAASVWVNAPQCMIALLNRGADANILDSSGRTVLNEAYATLRHGKDGPLEVLRKHCEFSEEDYTSAKQKDLAEALFVEVKKVMRVNSVPQFVPSLNRVKCDNAMRQGFTLHKKFYSTDLLREELQPMVVLPLSKMKEHGAIPRSSDNLTVPVNDLPDGSRVLFFSHRWLRPAEAQPDDEENSKYFMMIEAAQNWCARHEISDQLCYLWVDFACMDQDDVPRMIRGIHSLPFYIISCDGFVAISHSEYWHRAWCRVEVSFGVACSQRASLIQNGNNFSCFVWEGNTSTMQQLKEKVGDVGDPVTGQLFCEDDRIRIKSLVWFARNIHAWI